MDLKGKIKVNIITKKREILDMVENEGEYGFIFSECVVPLREIKDKILTKKIKKVRESLNELLEYCSIET